MDRRLYLRFAKKSAVIRLLKKVLKHGFNIATRKIYGVIKRKKKRNVKVDIGLGKSKKNANPIKVRSSYYSKIASQCCLLFCIVLFSMRWERNFKKLNST